MDIRSAINYVLWTKRDKLNEYKVVIVDRLCGSGYREIPMDMIERVDKHYIYLKSGNVIPIHRVVKIVSSSEVVWCRWSRDS